EYKDSITVDYDYEEQVRNVYRPEGKKVNYNRDTYNYEHEPSLYNLNDQSNQTLKLYEERLVASKTRVKTGEVSVGKHIETETARVSVPIEKERVVIERVTPTTSEAVVDSRELQFQEGEVARIELYEETPDIHKEAFVREEVRVRKVVDKETVEAQETIRREELDIDTEGDLRVNESGSNVNKTI
ncbi:MAG: YsnF/AvaK domain-containing protein, partial [Hassallia sp.]